MALKMQEMVLEITSKVLPRMLRSCSMKTCSWDSQQGLDSMLKIQDSRLKMQGCRFRNLKMASLCSAGRHDHRDPLIGLFLARSMLQIMS